ncbi:AIR synthase-related protein [Saccharopolyspora sp. NPDC047091]|uniref:AIR synthase-related protein n=1 Tax=Saccharopolyspora sp. NPDC047091 TaxID=3155924 RepID=UPI0033EF6964
MRSVATAGAVLRAEFRGAPPTQPPGGLVLVTDSFACSPLFFPGGTIGDLAVSGTVNALAVSGAVPHHLSVRFTVEAGFPAGDLRRVARSMVTAAEAAGVPVAVDGVSVVRRGRVRGCAIDTTGVGAGGGAHRLGAGRARPGDAVLVSGPVGEHGLAVALGADVVSDVAPLTGLASAVLAVPGVRALREVTGGGVAAALDEIARAASVRVLLDHSAVPVTPEVRRAADHFGIDPLHAACAGCLLAVVDHAHATTARTALRAHPRGTTASPIAHLAPHTPADHNEQPRTT